MARKFSSVPRDAGSKHQGFKVQHGHAYTMVRSIDQAAQLMMHFATHQPFDDSRKPAPCEEGSSTKTETIRSFAEKCQWKASLKLPQTDIKNLKDIFYHFRDHGLFRGKLQKLGQQLNQADALLKHMDAKWIQDFQAIFDDSLDELIPRMEASQGVNRNEARPDDYGSNLGSNAAELPPQSRGSNGVIDLLAGSNSSPTSVALSVTHFASQLAEVIGDTPGTHAVAEAASCDKRLDCASFLAETEPDAEEQPFVLEKLHGSALDSAKPRNDFFIGDMGPCAATQTDAQHIAPDHVFAPAACCESGALTGIQQLLRALDEKFALLLHRREPAGGTQPSELGMQIAAN